MLEEDQAAVAATLLHGPAHLPADLFAGDAAAIVRGLKVHANTISHARLVALEDTYPRTRALLGDARFNALSRDFLDSGGAAGLAHAQIGARFPAFLLEVGEALAADVARVESVWLASYHAAEGIALSLADLASLDEAMLLELPVRRHPAAAVVSLSTPAARAVDRGLAADCAALLITRREADVHIFAATAIETAALERAEENVALGNLIALFAEQHPGGAPASGSFIAAGALMRAGP